MRSATVTLDQLAATKALRVSSRCTLYVESPLAHACGGILQWTYAGGCSTYGVNLPVGCSTLQLPPTNSEGPPSQQIGPHTPLPASVLGTCCAATCRTWQDMPTQARWGPGGRTHVHQVYPTPYTQLCSVFTPPPPPLLCLTSA
jgi:hypothetical protein